MTPTKKKSGQFITGTSTESAFDLQGPWEGSVPTVTLELLTGSYQYATVPADAAPVIDSTFSTISTAGDKKLVSWKPGVEQLRIKGDCTVHVSY